MNTHQKCYNLEQIRFQSQKVSLATDANDNFYVFVEMGEKNHHAIHMRQEPSFRKLELSFDRQSLWMEMWDFKNQSLPLSKILNPTSFFANGIVSTSNFFVKEIKKSYTMHFELRRFLVKEMHLNCHFLRAALFSVNVEKIPLDDTTS